MSEVHVSPLIVSHCKRGHPRTKATTFERKSVVKGKTYIVRECRVCHSLRNIQKAGHCKTGAKYRSKWRELKDAGDAA